MKPRTNTQKISIATPADAKAWSKELGCTVAELRIAMRAVGVSTERVRGYLDALKERAAGEKAAPASDDCSTRQNNSLSHGVEWSAPNTADLPEVPAADA